MVHTTVKLTEKETQKAADAIQSIYNICEEENTKSTMAIIDEVVKLNELLGVEIWM